MRKKTYFAGLDGLRFIAIAFVVLHHAFTFRGFYDITNISFPTIGLIGYYGIQFFFVGSGFLITYLLLLEKKRNGKISLGAFYFRRILRIWPAYYFIVVLALFIFPYFSFFDIPGLTDKYYAGDYKTANLLYFSFLPHIAGMYYPTSPYIHPTYTIGMEEQFYFLWGLLFVLFFRRLKWVFWVLLIAIPLMNIINDVFKIDDGSWILHKYVVLMKVLSYFRLPTFSIGALWALAYFNGSEWLKIFERKWIQAGVYIVIILSISFDFYIPYFRDEYISFLMICLLSCAMTNQLSILNYERKWLRFLGRISYGIYLFHILAIVLAAKTALFVYGEMGSVISVSLFIFLTMLFSVLFGWISYVTIESFFLRIKNRFAKV